MKTRTRVRLAPTPEAREQANRRRRLMRQTERLLAPCRQCAFAECVRPCLEYQA